MSVRQMHRNKTHSLLFLCITAQVGLLLEELQSRWPYRKKSSVFSQDKYHHYPASMSQAHSGGEMRSYGRLGVGFNHQLLSQGSLTQIPHHLSWK